MGACGHADFLFLTAEVHMPLPRCCILMGIGAHVIACHVLNRAVYCQLGSTVV